MGLAAGVLALALAGLAAPPTIRRGIVPLAVGAAAVAIRLTLVAPTAVLDGEPVGRGPWTMLVETVGSPRDGHQVATLRTTEPGDGGFRVAATLPRFPSVVPGDGVRVGGRVRPRPDSPYGQYLARIGAWGTLDGDSLEPLTGVGGPARAIEELRRAAGDALTVTLPEPEAGLAAGILIGLRDRVDRDVAAAFTTAGVSHVVAISGWNIAIVAGAIAAVAGRIGRRRRAIVTVVAIALYVAFAGASPSVLRAGVMAGVVLLARETGRAGYAAAALGWAAAVLVVLDPAIVGDVGFQLSSIATAGLIVWATPLTERLARVGGGRMPRWLAESLGISLAAQAATLPIVLASFGRLALIAPVVNLLIVPLVAPAMAAGLVALLAGAAVVVGVPGLVGAVLSVPAWVALRILVSIVEASASLPLASVTMPPPSGAVLGSSLAALVVLWAAARRRRSVPGGAVQRARGDAAPTPAKIIGSAPAQRTGTPSAITRLRRPMAIGLVASLTVSGAVLAVRPSDVAQVTVLDVGQGDAILVEGSRGGRLLVDGGPDPDRLLVVLDRHIPPWDRRIDAVILTHPHEDHVAGLALLLDRYRIGRVFEPGMRGPGPGYAAWLDRLGRPGAPIRLGLATGDRLRVDDIRLDVLWPDRGVVPVDPPNTGTGINNVSIVLLGIVDGRRFLLTGDIEQDIDPLVLARGIPRLDLLKVAHHGSKTATTADFVQAAHPTIAIASAGADNPYGHPARSTMDRLRDVGSSVYRTDIDGTVTIAFEPGRMTVRTQPRSVADVVTRPGIAQQPVVAVRAVPLVTRTFACAIVTSARVVDTVPVAPTADGWRAGLLAASPVPAVRGSDRLDLHLRYHRADDGALAGGGRCPAALPGTARLGARTLARRGRGGSLARPADRGARVRARPERGGGRGSAARHRQVAACRRSGARPPPW
jgi:competence protein ComEC